jgi:hypothetical protein
MLRVSYERKSYNRDESRHVDVKVQYLRDLGRDGHVKLVKFAGTQNVSDALTKTLTRQAFEKHREYAGFPVCVCLFQLSLLLSRVTSHPPATQGE